MQLDLSDPDSIIAWWKVLPDRHDSYLAYKLKVSPEFAPAIREARRCIASSPELADLLEQADRRRRQHEARQAERNERLSAHEPTSSTTSRCSTTISGATAPPATLLWSSSNDAIPNDSQV